MKYAKYAAYDNRNQIAVGPIEDAVPFDLSVTHNNEAMRLVNSYSFVTSKQEEMLITMLESHGFKIVNLEDL